MIIGLVFRTIIKYNIFFGFILTDPNHSLQFGQIQVPTQSTTNLELNILKNLRRKV
jgi:hypothetical protein